jgi:ketosteroid isomerase-like protein
MSRENLELVNRYVVALNEREVPDDLLAPGFVMVNASTAVTDGTYHGASGVIQWTRDIFETLDADSRLLIERIEAEEDDHVVATVRIDGTGARSEMPFQFRWSTVFSCSEGKLTRVVGYLQLSEALEAVGLEG